MDSYLLILYDWDGGDSYEYAIIKANSIEEAKQKANKAGYKSRFTILSPNEYEFIE